MKYNYHYLFLVAGVLISLPLWSQLTFSNETQSANIQHVYSGLGSMGSGVACFDYNNDNYQDVYLTGGYGLDKLFKNNGDGTFTDVSANSGLTHINGVQTIGVVTGDIDNDGYRDVFITTRSATPSILYKNNGDGTFTDITLSAGINATSDGIDEDKQSFSASMGDINLDGYLDIYLVNWIDTIGYLYDGNNNLSGFQHQGAPNRLYLNNGDMTFTEVSDVYGVKDTGCGLASVFSDYDNDADADILVANDFGEWVRPDALYRNEYPAASCTDVSASSSFDSQIYGMGIGVGDYDQDGDLDYYKTSIGRNVLLNNLGNGTFQDTTNFAGVEDHYVNGVTPNLLISWGAGFIDYDHDTYLDLVVADGRVGSPTFFPSIDSMPDRLYKNNGNGTFTDVTLQEGLEQYGLSRGMAYGDMDNDGDMDILFTCVQHQILGIPGSPVYFQNNLNNGKNWLKVKLVGTVNNRDAMGSHIIIHLGEKSWIHEIGSGGQGHNSQHSSIAHFGLDAATEVDSLEVRWLGQNLSPNQMFYNIGSNRMIEITENANNYTVIHGPTATTPQVEQASTIRVFPNPTKGNFTVEYKVLETNNVQIDILNIEGKVLHSIINERQNEGEQRITWQGKNLPNGLYLVRIVTDNEVRLKKVVVLKN